MADYLFLIKMSASNTGGGGGGGGGHKKMGMGGTDFDTLVTVSDLVKSCTVYFTLNIP